MFWQKTIKKLQHQLDVSRIEKQAVDQLKDYYKSLLPQKDSINKSLADENRDLVRQLELYKAVLAQFSIPIKLPGKKA